MEVIARLRFITPCLGNERSEHLDKMLRNKEGKVIFLPSWWRAMFNFAAMAVSRWYDEVKQIQVDPEIVGTITVYKRYYKPGSYKEHEAFGAGDTIDVRLMLPGSISVTAFTELLETAGRYVGISPYGHKQDFGRFSVEWVKTIQQLRQANVVPSDDQKGGLQPSTNYTSVPNNIRAGADVH